ncbi:hypothetical protein [Roseomonas sp. WA12]
MLMPLQADLSLADAQIVVERRGPPSRSWWWKLVRDERPLIEGRHAYRGAEEAYEAARAELRRDTGAPIAMGRPAVLFRD